MPTSIDPPPTDDEVECANCGAHVYYELTRCPKCGVNLYEPDNENDLEQPQKLIPTISRRGGFFAWLDGFFRWLTNRPYPADELFGAAINQAELFNNLLVKVGGDRPTVERLIDFERQKHPRGNRTIWLENALRRWERDNRSRGG